MRIGIDLQVLANPRAGIGNYAFNLVSALLKTNSEHQFVLFFPEVIPAIPTGRQTEAGTEFSIRDQIQGDNRVEIVKLSAKRIPFWSAHVTNARIMKKENLDVLHGLANVLPLTYAGRGVVTVHDLAIYKHPEWFPRGQWLATKIVVPASIEKAKKIIVPSEATKADIIELFHVSDSKVHVIPHGVEERFFKKGEIKETRKYILFVGTLEPRKNVTRLIEAYSSLPEQIQNHYPLMIAGANGWGDEAENAWKKARGHNIQFLGQVSHSDLPALYQNASLFVYPSLYEGFGLPVLEAMAGGAPVVASRVSSLPEIASGPDQGAILVDPYSISSIREAMAKALTDRVLAKTMGERGAQRARIFTWLDTARRSAEVYAEMAHK